MISHAEVFISVENIKPCEYCGSREVACFKSGLSFYIECKNCENCREAKLLSKVIDKWNKRKSDD